MVSPILLSLRSQPIDGLQYLSAQHHLQYRAVPAGTGRSADVLVGTHSCYASHTGIVVPARRRVKMDDGTEAEFGPNDGIRTCVRVEIDGFGP